MGKKVSGEQEKIEFEKATGQRSGFGGILLLIAKGIIAVGLIPPLLSITNGFAKELLNQPWSIVTSFFLGVTVYVLVFLFIYDFNPVYTFGQNLIGRLFNFYLPLRKILFCGLPFYTTVLFVIYLIARSVLRTQYTIDTNWAVFILGLTMMMHLVLTAASLKKEGQDALKINYLFSLFLVYIFVIILLSAMLAAMLDKFSFREIMRSSLHYTVNTYTVLFQQLFVVH